MTNSASSGQPNRLIHETSPYLLQHAYNPVDWFPWGEEALRRAKQEHKPILLSIGYSACHWCHVMAHESFEQPQIASLMNEHYVCIKVDREERPDLDDIYMQATLSMNHGRGGWPMTVFLTPDQHPIFAGTYFPPTDRWGRPGFATVLQHIAEGWDKDRETITAQAHRLTTTLQTSLHAGSSMAIGQMEIDRAVSQCEQEFDPQYGGFGQAPKFPSATTLSFLLRQYHRTSHAHTLTMVRKTLDAMAAGGIYDQIGGGFARYSTDERWLIPHFEKMLYDNALLARTYTEAYQVTGDRQYKRIATETLDYVLREMTSPEGGFYSATDADSEGVEGKFFVWTPEQIQSIVGNEEDTRRFCAYYDITPQGNWEHGSILNIPESLDEVAKELDCSPEDFRQTIDRVRPLIYQARLRRVPPALDDKIITAWNGMMISAMAEAARVFNEQRYLDSARKAAGFLLTVLTSASGRLNRTYRKGNAHLHAYLEDYAYAAEGLLDLYESSGEEAYLVNAVQFAERILKDFSDPRQGGFFSTAHDHEALILRTKEGPDGAIPSSNAVAASALARIGVHLERTDFQEAAKKAIRAYGQQISRMPRGFIKSLMVADFFIHGPVELTLVGAPGHPAYEQLRQTMNQQFIPYRILAYHDPEGAQGIHPFLTGKNMVQGKPALYLCQNCTCQAPITDPDQIQPALADHGESGKRRSDISEHTLTVTGWPGMATAKGTAHYVSRQLGSASPSRPSVHGYTQVGLTGLTTSRIGFGGYRITAGIEEHHQALKKALQEGCNLIDTSTNYADGGSEQLIGQVLTELFDAHSLTREEVIVVSKIGYIQGENFQRAKAREQSGKGFPEIVKYGDGLWHCLHPDFLDEQLTRSLDRLGLATLDVCLLHNPEYFLSDLKNRKGSLSPQELESGRREFYHRLQQAFAYLESQIEAGRLQFYGISSNTCTAKPDDLDATSLSRMLESAEAAARTRGQAGHHFRVLQLPMNIMESGACLTPNTGANQSVLQLAQEAHIAVLANRPLNAIPADGNDGICRLADPQAQPVGTPFERQQQTVETLEEEFKQEIAPNIPYSGKGLEPKHYFTWAEALPRLRPQIKNLAHWDQIESQMIVPSVKQVMNALAKPFRGEKAQQWQKWHERYIPEFLTLLKILRYEAAEKSQTQLTSLTQMINPLLPPSIQQEPLARKSLWIIASTPGVTCVLNGMRWPAYVEDALACLQWELIADVRVIYKRLANLEQSPQP